MGELARGLVWGAGDRPVARLESILNFRGGQLPTAGLRLLQRPCADRVKNLEILSRWRSMILQSRVHSPKINEVGEGEGATEAEVCISPWIPQSAGCQHSLVGRVYLQPRPVHAARFLVVYTTGTSRVRI